MSGSLLSRLSNRVLGRAGIPPVVEPGVSYRRLTHTRLTETATVLDLRPDSFGIPHVRFAVAFERPEIGRYEGGLRILALRSFIDAYSERVL